MVTVSSRGRAEPSPNEQQPTVRWNDAWPRFRTSEYVATGAFISADIAIGVFAPQPSPKWRGMLPFDAAVGSALRADTGAGRRRAQRVSDALHVTNFLVSFLEAPLVVLLGHGDVRTHWDIVMMNAESFSAAGFIQLASSRLVGRTRPFVANCPKHPEEKDEFPCRDGGENLGFLSGHALASFVAAGLVCAHHARLPLYGGGAGDIAACWTMIGSAATTSVLRLVADQHYLSDVLLGAALGFTIGFGVPMLLHYRGDSTATQATTTAAPQMLRWGGSF